MSVALVGWVLAVAAGCCAAVLAQRLRSRAEMVVRACHELRSPLTSARLAVHLLAGGPAGGSSVLGSLDLELRRAGVALEDLAAASEGRAPAEREDVVDARELLEEVRAAWSLAAGTFGVELRVGAVPPGAFVRGDRERLSQAVGNLVGNGSGKRHTSRARFESNAVSRSRRIERRHWPSGARPLSPSLHGVSGGPPRAACAGRRSVPSAIRANRLSSGGGRALDGVSLRPQTEMHDTELP